MLIANPAECSVDWSYPGRFSWLLRDNRAEQVSSIATNVVR